MIFRTRIALPLVLAFVAACEDGPDDPAPDTSTIVDERFTDVVAFERPSFAVLEVEDGFWAATGNEIVRGTATNVTSVMKATRVHGSLVQDADFVYFATQSERSGVAGLEEQTMSPDGHLDDGAIYRARRDGTGTPEKLVDVGILLGAFALEGGHLYVCESPGLNGRGAVVDVQLGDSTSFSRHTMRVKEYCEAVVADPSSLYLAMDTSHKTVIEDGGSINFPKTLELARGSRATAWDKESGPPRVALTSLSPPLDGMFLTTDGIVLTQATTFVRYTTDGVASELPNPVDGADLVVPFGPDWLGASRGSQTNLREEICRGGRLWLTRNGERREVTQAVCAPRGFAMGSAIWMIESAKLSNMDPTATRYRVRVKRFGLP